MHRKKRLIISLLLAGVLLFSIPVAASAATKYVYYQGNFSDQFLTQILQRVFPGDDFRIIRQDQQCPQLQPEPEPEPTPEPEPKPEPAMPTPEPEPQPQPKPDPQFGQDTGTLTQDEREMVELVNRERQQAGLQPLKVDSRLVHLARQKSQDMVDKGYFGHNSPTYGSPFEMMKNAGVLYRYAGENIAGAGTVTRAHAGLMNSTGHRANILNPNFTHVGIGVVSGSPYGKIFTQMFIGV